MKTLRIFLLSCTLLAAGAAAYPAGRDIYPDPAQSRAEITAALKNAPQAHKRILLVFGGNWCGDCRVLDMYLHNDQNRPLLEANFILVHVNVGEYDANLDLAKQYEIPLQRGVPAIAVLSETGKLLYSQKSGEFEAMGRMEPSSVTHFLVQWKPAKAGCSMMATNC